jgi:hypothetical protein
VRALAKAAWVELALFCREPLTVLLTFAIPLVVLVVLVVLGGVLGNRVNPSAYRGSGPLVRARLDRPATLAVAGFPIGSAILAAARQR